MRQWERLVQHKRVKHHQELHPKRSRDVLTASPVQDRHTPRHSNSSNMDSYDSSFVFGRFYRFETAIETHKRHNDKPKRIKHTVDLDIHASA